MTITDKDNTRFEADKSKSKTTSLLTTNDIQTVENPFIIIIGICDYSNSRQKGNEMHSQDLNGVFIDVKKMYYLWNNIYNYNKNKKSIKIVCNFDDNDSKQTQSNSETNNICSQLEEESNKILNDKQEFLDFLTECRSIINYEKCYDSLILIYSGHGTKDKIILANGDLVELDEIYDVFNGKECKQLRNRLKLLIMDCCRGGQFAKLQEKVSEEKETDEKESLQMKGNPVDNKYHPYAGFATIFSNWINYLSGTHSKNGSYLIQSIYKTFENPDLASKHSLRDLIIPIRKQTKQLAGIGVEKFRKPAQCVDFHESLEFKVYFKKN